MKTPSPDRRLPTGLHLHFDPLSGIAGDMAVAALVDLGVPEAVVLDAIKGMGVKGLKARFETRKKGAFIGKGFVVSWPEDGKHASKPGTSRASQSGDHAHEDDHMHADHPHRGDAHDGHTHGPATHGKRAHAHRDYAEIRRLLARSTLPKDARALAEDVFARIAKVEAALHGIPVDRIAFHEVGAFDSIADIVGAAAALSWLAPATVSSSPLVLGTGRVRTDHGLVAVPAPATAALLTHAPVVAEGRGELATPTGAALLVAALERWGHWGPPPPWRLVATGYGAGNKDLEDRANVLRVTVGQPLGAALEPPPALVWLFEANLDDMNPQLVAPLLEALFEAGAVDAWSTPILMKKGRPGLTVAALAPADARAALERAFFLNSPTLGVRYSPVGRTVLGRSLAKVKTSAGEVVVKVASWDGQVVGATPEFEDVRARAVASGRPVRALLAEATAAAHGLVVAQTRTRRAKPSA